MNILFVMLHAGYVRNYESAIHLLASRGHTVHVAYERFRNKLGEKVQIERLAEDFPEQVSFSELPERRPTNWSNLATIVRTAADFGRYLDSRYRSAESLRLRIERAVPPLLAFGLKGVSLFGRPGLKLLRSACVYVDRCLPSDRTVATFIKQQNPDVMLVTPLVDFASPQIDYVKSAAARRIPSGLCVASWDNLTNKGLIRLVPDRVFVWNDAQKREAIELHDAPVDAVVATGAQLFDQWFGRQPSRDRTAFCARVGLDREQPFVLYLGSSFFIAPDEAPFGERWIRELRASTDPQLGRLGVLIRPHPTNVQQWLAFDFTQLGNVGIWPPLDAEPFSDEFRSDFFDSLYHSAVVVGVNTSAMIEAAIVGRPVCTMQVPEFAHSQGGTLHFQHLVSAHGGLLHVASSIDENLRQVVTLLSPTTTEQERSRRFVEAFVRPHGLDVAATPALVAAIEALQGLAPASRNLPPRGAALVRPFLAVLAAVMVRVWNTEPRRRQKGRGAGARLLGLAIRAAIVGYALPATALHELRQGTVRWRNMAVKRLRRRVIEKNIRKLSWVRRAGSTARRTQKSGRAALYAVRRATWRAVKQQRKAMMSGHRNREGR